MRRAINWFVVLLSAVFLLIGKSLSSRGGSVGGSSMEVFESDAPATTGMLRPDPRDLLMGLCIEPGHVKLAVYDSAQFENPQSRGSLSIVDQSSESASLYDAPPFTYLPGGGSDRLAVPAVLALRSELPIGSNEGEDLGSYCATPSQVNGRY